MTKFKNFFSLKGRMKQKEYTIWFSITYILLLIIQFGMLIISSSSIINNLLMENIDLMNTNISPISLLFSKISLITFILPVTITLLLLYILNIISIKRLHDINRSGWYSLIFILPIIGSIFLIVLCGLKSDPNNNKYGKNSCEIISS